ncbi:DUF6906 family protein [Paenibacillus monticola]|uniref:DUF6906 family protein n=1 Tax=Paenibacillus monticola TaxID=2666075 RepID=UPI003B83A2B1
MKQGRRPTRRQNAIIQSFKLNPTNWLVERESPSHMSIVHRTSGNLKCLAK